MVAQVGSQIVEFVVSQTGAVLIAAFVGSVVTLFGNAIRQQRKQKREAESLRWALRTEIKSMYGRLYALSEFRPKPEEVEDVFLTSVYEANVDRIGLLSNEEMVALIEFYGELINAQRSIQRRNRRRRRFDQQYVEVDERNLHSKALAALRELEDELNTAERTNPDDYNPCEDFGPTDGERRTG